MSDKITPQDLEEYHYATEEERAIHAMDDASIEAKLKEINEQKLKTASDNKYLSGIVITFAIFILIAILYAAVSKPNEVSQTSTLRGEIILKVVTYRVSMEVDVPYQPATPTVHAERQTETFLIEDSDTTGMQIVFGKTLYEGSYLIASVTQDPDCQLIFTKRADKNKTRVYQGSIIYTNKGDTLSTSKCGHLEKNGLEVTLEPEGLDPILSVSKREIQPYTTTESIIYNDFDETCLRSSSAIDCNKMIKYDELMSKKGTTEAIITNSRIESLVIQDNITACFIDYEKESCSKLYSLKYLEENIVMKKLK